MQATENLNKVVNEFLMGNKPDKRKQFCRGLQFNTQSGLLADLKTFKKTLKIVKLTKKNLKKSGFSSKNLKKGEQSLKMFLRTLKRVQKAGIGIFSNYT